MSAQEFKPGDRVRCVDASGQPSENLKLDDTALYTVASITHHGWLTLTSNPGPWLPSRFVKVDLESTEPEFVVGQQVSGDDYARLPVGSKVSNPNATLLTKVDEDGWTRDDGSSTRPHSNGSMRSNFTGRTLTHLPATEPEDKDDLYVEPGRMSKFIKGQAIRCINDKDQGTTANESLAYGAEYVIAETSGFAVRLADGDAFWDEDRFTAVLSPEPEDTDDVEPEPAPTTCDGGYKCRAETHVDGCLVDDVEPEPLKEGDWVQAWVQVESPEPDGDGNILAAIPRVNRFYGATRIQFDAIVRPDAGQVPPWVKRAPLTIDPNDEDGAVAELAHAIAEHCGVSVTFADLAKALAERSAAEGGAS